MQGKNDTLAMAMLVVHLLSGRGDVASLKFIRKEIKLVLAELAPPEKDPRQMSLF
jgi:hypothetical protein